MRKKFTMLFAALLAFVGVAKAQLVETSTADAPKYYVIASYNRGGYLTLENSTIGTGATHVALAEGSYWYFEKANENGGVYLVNKLKNGEDKVYLSSDRKASATASAWYLMENGVNKYGLTISSETPWSAYSCIDANSGNSGVGGWNPNKDDWHGTTWAIFEAEQIQTLENATYNPEKLAFRSRNDRAVTSVALSNSLSAAVSANTTTLDTDYKGYGLAYIDLTQSVTMKAVAGEEMTAAFTRNASSNWTNAYVYIDLNNDGFTASVAEDGFTPAEDLMTYSFYSGDETNDVTGKNSKGEELTEGARNTMTMPAFKAPNTLGTYRLRFKLDWNSINPNGGNANFKSNGGSIIDVMLEVVSSTIEVQYSYQYNGVEKYTQTSTALVGGEYPALTETAKFPFGITATKPTGVITEADVKEGVVTKVVELTNNLPFVPANSYATIENWYYLNIHANGYYLNHKEGATSMDLTTTTVPADNKDAYSWAFIGNPYDGFQIVNKAAGEKMILSSSVEMKGENGGETYPVMTSTPVAEGNNTYWVATKSDKRGENGFYLAQKDYASNRMNRRGNSLAYWSTGADGGSTFKVELRNATIELNALIAKIEVANINSGTNPGEYTEAAVAALNTAIAAAKNIQNAQDSDVKALQDIYDALEVNPINTACKYFIVNAKPAFNGSKVLSAHTVCGWNHTNHNPGWEEKNTNDPLQYWTIETVGENYYLKAAYEGSYVTSVNTLSEEAKAVSFNWLAVGQYNITIDGAVFHADLHGWGVDASKVIGYPGGADSPSAWKLVAVSEEPAFMHELTVGATGYSSLMLAYNAIIPDGVTCNTVSVENGCVFLKAIEGNVLPANTPVVVAATPAEKYTFVSTTEEATVSATNELQGTLYPKLISREEGTACYVLANKNNVVGFYKAALDESDNTAFLNGANKVYLPVTVAEQGAPAMFAFTRGEEGDDSTGIENVELGEELVIYDLTGRRVQKLEKGIYIVNGKKVVIK